MKMKFKTLLLAAAIAMSAPAMANSNFNVVYDNSKRIQTVTYSENLVIKVAGYKNNPSVIVFGEDETITAVAGGEIVNWELCCKNKGRNFYFRPLDGAKAGTVIVTTDKHNYVIDLYPAGGNIKNRVSKIIMKYPDKKGDSDSAGTEQDSPPMNSGIQNFNYSMEIVKEDENFRPLEVFDNGTFTYMKFDKNVDVPAIYKSTPGSENEWLINSHKENGYIVLHGVSPLWNLRIGDSLIGVFNDSYKAKVSRGETQNQSKENIYGN